MKIAQREYSVVDWAYEVLDMHNEILSLRRKVKHLNEINDLLHESVNASAKHGDKMIAGMLAAAIGANDLARDILTEKEEMTPAANDSTAARE